MCNDSRLRGWTETFSCTECSLVQPDESILLRVKDSDISNCHACKESVGNFSSFIYQLAHSKQRWPNQKVLFPMFCATSGIRTSTQTVSSTWVLPRIFSCTTSFWSLWTKAQSCLWYIWLTMMGRRKYAIEAGHRSLPGPKFRSSQSSRSQMASHLPSSIWFGFQKLWWWCFSWDAVLWSIHPGLDNETAAEVVPNDPLEEAAVER